MTRRFAFMLPRRRFYPGAIYFNWLALSAARAISFCNALAAIEICQTTCDLEIERGLVGDAAAAISIWTYWAYCYFGRCKLTSRHFRRHEARVR